MPLASWLYFRSITDSTGGSLSGAVCKLSLTSANFDFTLANSDGSDLRVYDETAAALVPHWRMDFDPVAQTATVFYKAALTSHAHSLYYGNPSRTDTSSFSAVYDHGTGFDFDWGDLTTAVAGTGGAATQYPGPTSVNDSRNYIFWRLQETPTLSLSDLTSAGIPASSYTGIREFNLIRDNQNRVLNIGGLYYATFSRRPSVNTLTIDSWIASSSSKSGPWSGFAKMWTTGTEHLNYSSSPIKIGSTYYTFVTFGWANGGGNTPGLVVKLRTSTDLVTWTDKGTVLSPGVFNDITSGACTEIGNPWVIPLADGTYMMTVEGMNITNNQWSCYGAISSGPPFTTWTPLNSGNPLIAKGAGGTWDANGTANPKCFQLPDHTIVIEYNGSDDNANLDWELGWTSAPVPAGPYTKNAANPVAGHTTGTYGCETAHFSWDENGVDYFHACQRFDTASNTAHAFFLYQEKRQGGLLISRDPTTATDGAVAGILLGSGTFTAESRSVILAHRSNNGTPILLGLWDEAAVPTPAANAGLLAVRCVEIRRRTHDSATPGDITFVYFDGSSTQHFWTGSAWSTTLTVLAADYAREVIAQLKDDGTNYIFTATYADDGSAISGPASIAKTSVRTMTNRLLICGDPFTDAWCQALYARRISTRPYVATEPILSLGAQQQSPATAYTIATPSPDSGYANNVSSNFTVTPNGLYSGTVTLTPTGGGLSTPIILTWIASSTPTTFTITPRAVGVVTLTPVSSPVLTNPAAATYTAAAQTLSVGPLTLTALAPQTVNFQGGGTTWSRVTPTFSVSGPGAAGTTVGPVTVTSDTACSALVSPGATAGSLTFTDGTTGATASATLAAAPVSSATGWSYLSSVSTFAAGLAGSVGYTVLHSDGSTQAARSMTGVFAVGSVGYAAPVPLPITGAFVILWDDGAGHAAFETVSPRGCEPPSAALPGGLTVEQGLAAMLAALSGVSDGFVRGGLSRPTFYAPDGVTPRVTGTEDGAGNRTGIVLTPPQ
jgi:Domain of unknown function (DUF2341)